MKAKGPKIERETVISFNDDEDFAQIWIASDRTYKTMIKRGYVQSSTVNDLQYLEYPKNASPSEKLA